MGFDAGVLERLAQDFRADLWYFDHDDVLEESGIAERRFGPVQVTVIETLPDAPTYNTVVGAAEPGAVRMGHLERAIEWVESLRLDYRVLVGHERPETDAAEELLNRRGFEQGTCLLRYTRDTAAPSGQPGVPGVKVWEIGVEAGEEDLAVETMAFSAAPVLGLPSGASTLISDLPRRERWRCFSAELEGEIVAYGSMLIGDRVAGLGLEATVPRARGRGCNRALLQARIAAAQEAGCATICADAPSYGGEPGPCARNLIRTGFAPVHRSVNWQRPR